MENLSVITAKPANNYTNFDGALNCIDLALDIIHYGVFPFTCFLAGLCNYFLSTSLDFLGPSRAVKRYMLLLAFADLLQIAGFVW